MTFLATIGILALQPMDRAYAQADPNIQSRIDAVAAPFQVQPIPIVPGAQTRPAPQTIVETEPACVAKGHRCLSNTEIDAVFAKHATGPRLFSLTPGTGTDALTELKSEATPLDRKLKIIKTLALPINIKPSKKKTLALPVGPPNLKPGPGDAPTQPTAVSFTFPSSPIYESNANRSNTLGRSDGSVSFGGGFTVTTQGFRNLDVIGISAGTSMVRYARLDKSFDTLTASAQYQLFLGAYDVTATTIPLAHGSNLPTGQVTFNTLTFGLQNSTAFSPTFHAETTSLTTPTLVYSWQNIPFTEALCATRLHKETSSFCYYADLSVTLGHTLADVRALENTNLAVSATLGDRIGNTDFVALWGTTITGRTYENVLGGRNDVMVTFGPKLQYKPIDKLTTSIGITYNRNYSSLATAQWHGWIAQSALTLSF